MLLQTAKHNNFANFKKFEKKNCQIRIKNLLSSDLKNRVMPKRKLILVKNNQNKSLRRIQK